MSLAGHVWTVFPHVRARWGHVSDEGARPWTTEIRDARVGRVRLSGLISEPPEALALLIVVHGLGGSAGSSYMLSAARAAHSAGLATLRLSLRGADSSGEDVYNAGLTDDVRAAVASQDAARYRTVLVLGFSLGGHVALRVATERPDPRIAAVAAVCAPLDLASCQAAIDAPSRFFYRRYLLARLRRSTAAVAARGRLAVTLRELRSVRTIREWDRLVVAPRFGFADPDDYYARSSVAPRLGRLAVPALLVAAANDPMVPAATLRPWLEAAPSLEVRWAARGGHIGFPRSLDLGERGPLGIDGQVVAWLRRHG